MSFSNPKLQNPASKFIEFKGDKGIFQYWDKEQEKNIELEMPYYFVVLDELTTIKGFSNQHESGIYSNEIHDLNSEILTVRDFGGNIRIVGKYQEIKHEIKAEGGKYCKSIYAMCFDKSFKNFDLVNFQLSGAAFSAYLNVKIKVGQNAVGLTGECEEKKNGSIVYKEPIFKRYKIEEKLIAPATDLDKQLQEYFRQYKVEQDSKSIEKVEKTENEVYVEEIQRDYEQQAQDVSKQEFESDDLPF